MVIGEGPESGQQVPGWELHEAMQAAEQGVMPSFTAESLMDRLNLAEDSPDERTLMDRFTDGARDPGSFRAIIAMRDGLYNLIDATNEYTANPAQEAVAGALGKVITRQLTREGDICPGARDMALASERDDIVPVEVRQSLAGPEIPEILDVDHLPPELAALLQHLGLMDELPLVGIITVSVPSYAAEPPRKVRLCRKLCSNDYI